MATFLRRFIVTLLALAAPLAATAMSVIPPTFDQLVSAADVIVRGVVTDVHCVTVDTPQGQAIRTLVTFRVERTLKGNPGEEITLAFLGGKVGRRTLSVQGMPTFQVGDREIVFVGKNGQTICPVIAAGHGRYHVRHDAASNRDFVARDNGAPLTSTDEITVPLDASEQPRRLAAAQSDGLTPESFEAKIAAAVHGSATPVQP